MNKTVLVEANELQRTIELTDIEKLAKHLASLRAEGNTHVRIVALVKMDREEPKAIKQLVYDHLLDDHYFGNEDHWKLDRLIEQDRHKEVLTAIDAGSYELRELLEEDRDYSALNEMPEEDE